MVHVTGATLPAGDYPVTVGLGGARKYVSTHNWACSGQDMGHHGGDSKAFGETAKGGGAGGGYEDTSHDTITPALLNGGSGSGASDRADSAGKGWDGKGAGTSTQGSPALNYGGSGQSYGHRGGTSNGGGHCGGGGGGATAEGQACNDCKGGNGGNGVEINIDGNKYCPYSRRERFAVHAGNLTMIAHLSRNASRIRV